MGTGVFVWIADRSQVPRTGPRSEQVLSEDLLKCVKAGFASPAVPRAPALSPASPALAPSRVRACPQQSPQCPLDLLVPQSVNEGIQQGSHQSVEERDAFVHILRVTGGGLEVHGDERAEEDDHHHQVRAARAEGLAPPPGRRDRQDGPRDAAVGHYDERQRHHEEEDADREELSLVDGGVGAGQLQHRRHFAEEMVHPVSPAQWQRHGQGRLQRRVAEAREPSRQHQPQAELRVHHGQVVQGAAHGRVAVIGHDGQEHTLHAPQPQGDEELGHTATIADGLVPPLEVGQRLGDGAGGQTKVHEREVGEEEIHGGVQARVRPRQKYNRAVAEKAQEVDDQDDHKESRLQLRPVGEAQEEES